MRQSDIMRADRGATAIEYALLIALIAVAAIAAMDGVGQRLLTTFMVIAEALGFGGMGSGAPPAP